MLRSQRIVFNGIVMYFRVILMMLITLYTSRIVINFLGEEVFGLFSIITGVVILGAFVTTVLESTAQRFISESIALQKDVQATISTLISINLLIAVLLGGVVFIIGSLYVDYQLIQDVLPNDIVKLLLALSIMTFMTGVICSPILSILIAYERMGLYSLITFIEVIVRLALVKFVIFELDNEAVYYALVLLFSVVFSRSIALFLVKTKLPSISLKPFIDRVKVKEILSYVGWNTFGSLASVANAQGINIVINVFFSLSVSASRAIALQLNTAITQLINSVQIAMNPQIVKSYARKDTGYLTTLMSINGRVVAFLCSLILVALVGNVETLLSLWLGKYPHHLTDFVYLMLVDVFIISQTGPLVSLVQATGKIKTYQVVVGSTMLLNIPLCLYALTVYEVPIVVYLVPIFVSCICMLERVYFVHSQSIISVKSYILAVMLRSLLITGSLIGVKVMLISHYSSMGFFFDVIFSILTVTIAWSLFGTTNREKRLVVELYRKHVFSKFETSNKS